MAKRTHHTKSTQFSSSFELKIVDTCFHRMEVEGRRDLAHEQRMIGE